MTQDQFNRTMRNLDHISTICTRSIRASRHGQNLAPKVGPLSHYYRLFEDFCEILHLESDKILTLKEYLLDHEYRLVLKPPLPPKVTGLRKFLQHCDSDSEDDAPNTSPHHDTDRSESDTSDDSSDSDPESDSDDMSNNSPEQAEDYDSDVELLL